jgi:hypothetical protein
MMIVIIIRIRLEFAVHRRAIRGNAIALERISLCSVPVGVNFEMLFRTSLHHWALWHCISDGQS